jgi:cobalamin-dependent methionine synthase I
MDPKEILRKIEKSKQDYSKRVEKQMLDRVTYGAKETLDYFVRREAKGYTSKETLEDIERAKYK